MASGVFVAEVLEAYVLLLIRVDKNHYFFFLNKKNWIFFFKSKKSDFFDLNQIFLI